jgi:hypothetical protein
MRWLAMFLFLVAGCAAQQPQVTQGLDVEVESWESVDIARLNARVGESVAAAETWAASPLRMTVELFGADVDTRVLWLTEKKNRGEGADTTVVTMVRDGFLDDSVRGDWHRIVYYRQADGTWRLHEMRRAFRCWRGRHLEAYSSQLCP